MHKTKHTHVHTHTHAEANRDVLDAHLVEPFWERAVSGQAKRIARVPDQNQTLFPTENQPADRRCAAVTNDRRDLPGHSK